MLSQKTHSLFLILSSIRSVQSYLIVSLPNFLLQYSLRLFVCGFMLITVSDLIFSWFSVLKYFRSSYLYQITLILADSMYLL